jgi:hypothetical protein
VRHQSIFCERAGARGTRLSAASPLLLVLILEHDLWTNEVVCAGKPIPTFFPDHALVEFDDLG